MQPAALVRRIPLSPHQWTSRITPASDIFILSHMGTPQFEVSDWRLEVCGEVKRSLSLSISEILKLKKTSVTSFHQCAGFPKDPTIATRRLANAVWSGVAIADILAIAGLSENARYVWSYGLDFGEYEGIKAENYVKDIPLDRAMRGDTILAYEVNGEQLDKDHGYPLRLVVPGYYGTNWVKWICRLEVSGIRYDGLFTRNLYNDPITGSKTGQSKPVWAVSPESAIVAPSPGATIDSETVTVWGWAWGEGEIVSVEISADDGVSWREAVLEAPSENSWRRFSIEWAPPSAGQYSLMSRAKNVAGEVQPLEAWRNSVRVISVTVKR